MRKKSPLAKPSLRRPSQRKHLRKHLRAQHGRTHQQWYLLEQHQQLDLQLLAPINPLAQEPLLA